MAMKENIVSFEGGKGVTLSDFIFNGYDFHTGFEKPKKRPPLEDQSVSRYKQRLTISVKCVRVGNTWAADWFRDTVGGDPARMLGLANHGAIEPKELNLSYSGKLIVNGEEYEVTLGQGHRGVNNPWWVASPVMTVVNRKAPKASFGDQYWIEEGIHDAVQDFTIKLK